VKQLSLLFITSFAVAAFAQAPDGWQRISDAKPIQAGKSVVKEIGVWKSPDSDLRVQVLELDPIKTDQDLWNFVGGVISGINNAGQGPTSCDVIDDARYLCFRLTGSAEQQALRYNVDTYIVFADLHTYIVKAFRPGVKTGFSIEGWNFGFPPAERRTLFAQDLRTIKTKIDSGESLVRTEPPQTGSKARTHRVIGDERKASSSFNLFAGLTAGTAKFLQGSAQDVLTAALDLGGELVGENSENEIQRNARAIMRIGRINRNILTMEHSVGIDPDSASYRLGVGIGGCAICLGIVGVAIWAWTRRVSSRMALRSHATRSEYYRVLLTKMSWRLLIIFLIAMTIVILSQNSPAVSREQAGQAGAIAMVLLLLFCLPVMFATSWTRTKRKFVQAAKTTETESHIGLRQPGPPPLPDQDRSFAQTLLDKSAAPQRRINSTWWKRLFTVLEIGALAISLLLAVILLSSLSSSDSRWPLLILLIVPVAIVRAVRIAVVYVVEGTKPFRH